MWLSLLLKENPFEVIICYHQIWTTTFKSDTDDHAVYHEMPTRVACIVPRLFVFTVVLHAKGCGIGIEAEGGDSKERKVPTGRRRPEIYRTRDG